jgi:hypothetical protein
MRPEDIPSIHMPAVERALPIFFYGAMKRDMASHYKVSQWLNTESESVQTAVLPNARMHAHPRGWPFIVPDVADMVGGELFTFKADLDSYSDALHAIDRSNDIRWYEPDRPANFERRVVQVFVGDGEQIEAWAYYAAPKITENPALADAPRMSPAVFTPDAWAAARATLDKPSAPFLVDVAVPAPEPGPDSADMGAVELE